MSESSSAGRTVPTTPEPVGSAPPGHARHGSRALTRRQRVGLWAGGTFSLLVAGSALSPTPAGELGPPLAVLLLGSLLGVVGLVAAILALRTGRPLWSRVLAGMLVLNALTSVPAFFVPEVPAGLVVLAAAGVLVTIAIVILLLSGPRRDPFATS